MQLYYMHLTETLLTDNV